MSLIGIVTAMRAEAKCVTPRRLPFNEMVRLREGTAIWICGIGDAAARKAATGLRDQGVSALVSLGVAGALSETLRPGDLVLPEYIQNEQSTPVSVALAWRARIKQLLPSHVNVSGGTLATSRQMLSSETAKRAFSKKHGACAVDMESGAIAEVAAKAGIPFVAVRAITDPLEFSPPPVLMNAVYPDGSVNIPQLVSLLLRRSININTLLQLAPSMRAACSTLLSVVQHADNELGGQFSSVAIVNS
ncbi:MAG: phosphorylase [Nitrosomonas sp.]|nr:phosphorylase [Nitrosomonas sp.]MBK7364626.1 phosphorylase [Nitrosomonas sp.]